MRNYFFVTILFLLGFTAATFAQTDSAYIAKNMVLPDMQVPADYDNTQVKAPMGIEYRLTEEEMQQYQPIYASAGGIPQSRFRNKVGHVGGLQNKISVWKEIANNPEGSAEFNAAVYKKTHGLYNLGYPSKTDPNTLNARLMNDLGYLTTNSPDSTQLENALNQYKSDLKSTNVNTRFELGKRFMKAGEDNKNFYLGALEQFEWIATERGTTVEYDRRNQMYDFLDDISIYFSENNDRTNLIRLVLSQYKLFPNRGSPKRALKSLNIPLPKN